MPKKFIAALMVTAAVWYFFVRTTIKIPEVLKFNNSTYQLQKTDSQSGAKTGYYLTADNTLADFDDLVMVTAWPKEMISFEDFDKRFRTAISAGLRGKIVADNGDDDSCWVVKSVNPPQTIDIAYTESEEAFVQVSYTRVIDQATDRPNCSDHSSFVQPLLDLVDW